MTERFRLAPMSPLIRWLTWGLCALPVGFVAAGLTGPRPAPMLWVGLLLVALYAAVWIWWRPGWFEVSGAGLALVFPGRRCLVHAADIASAEMVTAAQLRARFGTLLRVGAGGLWGGFGWLWSPKGWVEFYVSATDGFVLIGRRRGIPLLISPEHPGRMLASLRARGLTAASAAARA